MLLALKQQKEVIRAGGEFSGVKYTTHLIILNIEHLIRKEREPLDVSRCQIK